MQRLLLWVFGCYQNYKEQKLKANHNYQCLHLLFVLVVIKTTKNKSWKQITTRFNVINISLLLLSKLQRTKVESKSQRQQFHCSHLPGCYQNYKEQKLKANHNRNALILVVLAVVIKTTKNKSWKQITTITTATNKAAMLLSKLQRTKVESKSQLWGLLPSSTNGCYQNYKEQKLKANHNLFRFLTSAPVVVIKTTKNKSWKQITTMVCIWLLMPKLLSKLQRTKVESKSQQAFS